MATRTRQRERTRQLIVDATARLLSQTATTSPSIDEIADAAGVSRATVYRYFANADDIVWQAFADELVVDVASVFDDIGDDPAARLARVEEIVNDFLFADPNGVRAFERTTLDRELRGTATPADRPRRRLAFIDAALAPLADRVESNRLALLRHALTLAIGTQAVVALLDVCDLDADRARDVTRFATDALLRAALSDD